MKERRTIRKWIWAWNFDKEEQWLNAMAQSGWVLESVGFVKYNFVRCEPGEYTVRLEMHNHDEEYISFMEETGAEYVGRMMTWVYFRKKVTDGECFDIYSDKTSKIKYFERIAGVLGGFAIANLIIGVIDVIIALFDGQFVNMMGILNIVLAVFLYGGYRKINRKCDAIVQEHTLFE